MKEFNLIVKPFEFPPFPEFLKTQKIQVDIYELIIIKCVQDKHQLKDKFTLCVEKSLQERKYYELSESGYNKACKQLQATIVKRIQTLSNYKPLTAEEQFKLNKQKQLEAEENKGGKNENKI